MSNQNGNNATKVYLEGVHGIRVPARKISLTNGEDPVYVYDTSGPQGGDVRNGLPPLREAWIRARGDVEDVTPAYVPQSGAAGNPGKSAPQNRPARHGQCHADALCQMR